MDIELTADEVFKLAEGIEQAAYDFYMRAAENVDDPETRQVLLELAALEQVHESVFLDLRRHQPGRQRQSLKEDASAVRLLAQGMEETLGQEVGVYESSGDVLRKALAFEKDSVKLFQDLREMLSKEDEQQRVNEIIHEEMQHVLMLNNALTPGQKAEA